jgi:hypothetical protein
MFMHIETQVVAMAWQMHELFYVDMWRNWSLSSVVTQRYMVHNGPGATAWLARAQYNRQRELQAWLAMNPNATAEQWPKMFWFAPNPRY